MNYLMFCGSEIQEQLSSVVVAQGVSRMYRQAVTGIGGTASKPAHVGAGKGLSCSSHGPLPLRGSQQGSWQSEWPKRERGSKREATVPFISYDNLIWHHFSTFYQLHRSVLVQRGRETSHRCEYQEAGSLAATSEAGDENLCPACFSSISSQFCPT